MNNNFKSNFLKAVIGILMIAFFVFGLLFIGFVVGIKLESEVTKKYIKDCIKKDIYFTEELWRYG